MLDDIKKMESIINSLLYKLKYNEIIFNKKIIVISKLNNRIIKNKMMLF